MAVHLFEDHTGPGLNVAGPTHIPNPVLGGLGEMSSSFLTHLLNRYDLLDLHTAAFCKVVKSIMQGSPPVRVQGACGVAVIFSRRLPLPQKKTVTFSK